MNPIAISRKNRKKKYKLFINIFQPSEKDILLDVGFNNEENTAVDNYLERNYPYLSNITALGIDSDCAFKKRYPEVSTVLYDGKTFPFKDNSFDIGWSNAVIEHVGNEEAQILFLKELKRVCKRIYFTTPNRFFPFEVHTRVPFVQWLPKKACDTLLSLFGKKWATGDYMHLLSRKQLERIIKEAGITEYTIHKNRFLGFTMDFSVIIQQ